MEQKQSSNIKFGKLILVVAVFGILLLGFIGASTTIMLQDADTENLDDTSTRVNDGSSNGDDTFLRTGNEDVELYRTYLKFNLEDIPASSEILNATLYLYLYSSEYESGETPNIDLYGLDNYSWSEETLLAGYELFNSIDSLQDNKQLDYDFTGWLSFNASENVKKTYTADKMNVSFTLNDSLASSFDYSSFYSKEYETASLRPYLNITYLSAEGPNSPGTMANDSSVGDVGYEWLFIDNVKTQSDSYAQISSGSIITYYLKATNFDFAIPTDATIDGINVEIEKVATGAGLENISDYSVRLVASNGTIVGENKAILINVANWSKSDTDTYTSYGGSSDLWGVSWSDTDINNANFGVVISADIRQQGGPPAVAFIDHFRIKVYYTEAEGGPESKGNYLELSGGNKLSLFGDSKLTITK